jgi:hypothetical protein
MRKALFCQFVMNLLLALLIWLGGSFYVAVGYTVMFSKYRELDAAHAVDYELLKSECSLDAEEDWGVVVEYLVDEFVQGVAQWRNVIAILFALNGLIAFVLWRYAVNVVKTEK